jgi:hypothetical protein
MKKDCSVILDLDNQEIQILDFKFNVSVPQNFKFNATVSVPQNLKKKQIEVHC